MVDQEQFYLGTGWSFPPTFEKTARQVELKSSHDDIQDSLKILLRTMPGERVMQPTYGCDLSELMFDPLSPTVASHAKELIRTAILYHEPRIRLEVIDLQMNSQLQGAIRIWIEYTVLSTNSRFSFVYPLYYQEGTGLT